MRNKTEMHESDVEEIESRKAVRRFRNRYLAGSVVVPAVKWGLITLGVLSVIGMVTKDKDEVESKDEN